MDLHMYSVVHRTVKGTKESPIDFKAMQEQQRRAVALENSLKVQKELEEKRIAKNKQMAMEHAAFAQSTSKIVRNAAMNKMYSNIAEECLGEAFSYIYLNSLPHDKHFIKENAVPLIKMGCFYMKKLGGMKYLKQRVMETHNPFLSGLYNAVEETAKDIYKKRAKKVANTISDEEAMNIINGKVGDKSRNEMLAKIDSLGADELSELVKNKVIAVVKDEHQREKDERDFRSELKNDINDPELSPSSAELGDSIGDIDTGDDMEDVDSVDDTNAPDPKKPAKAKKSMFTPKKVSSPSNKDKEKKDDDFDENKPVGLAEKKEKKDNTKAGMVAKLDKKKDDKKIKTGLESYTVTQLSNRWDPVKNSFTYNRNSRPKDLFYAINYSVMRDMVNDSIASENATAIADKPKAPQYVLENPLNLDVFMTYMLKDNEDGIEDITLSSVHEPKVMGSTNIDTDSVLTESTIQYTLLEAAHTMRLIDPSEKQIKEQSDYLLGIR